MTCFVCFNGRKRRPAFWVNIVLRNVKQAYNMYDSGKNNRVQTKKMPNTQKTSENPAYSYLALQIWQYPARTDKQKKKCGCNQQDKNRADNEGATAGTIDRSHHLVHLGSSSTVKSFTCSIHLYSGCCSEDLIRVAPTRSWQKDSSKKLFAHTNNQGTRNQVGTFTGDVHDYSLFSALVCRTPSNDAKLLHTLSAWPQRLATATVYLPIHHFLATSLHVASLVVLLALDHDGISRGMSLIY